MIKSIALATVLALGTVCAANASVTLSDTAVSGTDANYTSGGVNLVSYSNGAYSPATGWVSTTADGGSVGNVTVVTTFTSDGAYNVSGNWGVDNSGSLYLVNAAAQTETLLSTISYGYPAFQIPTAFSFTVGAGTYELEFLLNNAEGPFALRVGEVAVSAVPEPSTWAMMLLGFCGLGFVTYRRGRNAANLSLT